MTRDELMIAFEMRIDGKSWIEIGNVLNYDESVARQQVRRLVITKEKEEENEDKLQRRKT